MTSDSSLSQAPTAEQVHDELSPDKLLDAAFEETGLSDLDPATLGAFRMLVECAVRDIAFSPIGAMTFKADMHRRLVNALRMTDDLHRHPEILEEDVSDPIVILGLARTGTTKLQRMISADPHVHKFHFWRLFNPAPVAAADPARPDPRIEIARDATAGLHAMYPDFLTSHPTVAEDVDEDMFLMEFCFEAYILYLRMGLPSYYKWVVNRDKGRSYRFLHTAIQYLQWQDGGKRNQPWIMKSPVHTGALDALIKEFPGATLVHCHRDLGEVMPSFCKLIEGTWRLYADSVDTRQEGHALLNACALEMDKYLKIRGGLGESVAIYDVAYSQLVADPMPIIREIYRRAGRPLGDDSVQAMLAWNEKNPKDMFGKHVYGNDRYGLTAEAIGSAFRGYIEEFGPYLGTQT